MEYQDRTLLSEWKGTQSEQTKLRTANLDLVHAAVGLLIKDDPIEEANIMINHDSGRESPTGAEQSQNEATHGFEGTRMMSSHLATEGKATGSQQISEQLRAREH